jgi:hypothetical protein
MTNMCEFVERREKNLHERRSNELTDAAVNATVLQEEIEAQKNQLLKDVGELSRTNESLQESMRQMEQSFAGSLSRALAEQRGDIGEQQQFYSKLVGELNRKVRDAEETRCENFVPSMGDMTWHGEWYLSQCARISIHPLSHVMHMHNRIPLENELQQAKVDLEQALRDIHEVEIQRDALNQQLQRANSSSGLPVVEPPSMDPLGGQFHNRVIVTIRSNIEGSAVVGTNDGSEPSIHYSGPGHFRGTSPFKITLVKTAELKFLVVTADGRYSRVTTRNFIVQPGNSANVSSKNTGRASSLPVGITALANAQCSVGILFEKQGSGIIVHRLIPGGAAERDGRILKGDLVLSVDGRPSSGMNPATMRDLVSGQEGSRVSMIFQRAGAQLGDKAVLIEAVLVRAAQRGPFAFQDAQV